jgi:hypothetical protein
MRKLFVNAKTVVGTPEYYERIRVITTTIATVTGRDHTVVYW